MHNAMAHWFGGGCNDDGKMNLRGYDYSSVIVIDISRLGSCIYPPYRGDI